MELIYMGCDAWVITLGIRHPRKKEEERTCSYVTRPIHMGQGSFILDMTHPYGTWHMIMGHDYGTWNVTHSYVTWPTHMGHDPLIRDTSLSYGTSLTFPSLRIFGFLAHFRRKCAERHFWIFGVKSLHSKNQNSLPPSICARRLFFPSFCARFPLCGCVCFFYFLVPCCLALVGEHLFAGLPVIYWYIYIIVCRYLCVYL